MAEFRVTLSRTVVMEAELVVEAPDKMAAAKLAETKDVAIDDWAAVLAPPPRAVAVSIAKVESDGDVDLAVSPVCSD